MNENLEMPLYSVFYHGGCLYEPSLGLEAQYFIDRQWATTTCAPPSDDRNNQAVSFQAIFPTTGPHQLITSRNHVLTDGPMHIDRPALPRSKSPNANESFPIWEREGKKHSSSAWHHTCTAHSTWRECTQITAAVNSPKTSAARIHTTRLPVSPSSPLSVLSLCLSRSPSFSPQPSFFLGCVAVIFHRSELAEAVNTPLLRLRTQSDPATSVSLMPLPRSLIPRPLWCSALVAAQTL